MKTIAERLLLIRGKVKQGDFAKALGVNPNTLRSYENGRSSPNQEFLERICVQFSVSPAWLLLGHGAMRSDTPRKTLCASALEVQPTEIKTQNACQRCAKLEAKLEKVEAQRDELAVENRQLWKENGDLREELATLKERANTPSTLGLHGCASSVA